MTNKERVHAALEGKPVDRCPVTSLYNFLYQLDHFSELTGLPPWRMHQWLAESPDAHVELYARMQAAAPFELLAHLVTVEGIAWNRVTIFHLDEYIGLPIAHPASFRHYLWTRFARQLPLPPAAFHFIDGEADPACECARLGELIRQQPVDVAFIGIGENGHLAFNDPPADFETGEPYIVVTLDETCRRQQLGEGWFPSLEAVPERAISMSVRQILNSAAVVCTVPDARKAEAVRQAVKGPVTNRLPASILQTHPAVTLFLDQPAASLLA